MADAAVQETFGEALIRVMDGRKMPWLAERTGIDHRRLLRLSQGRGIPRLEEAGAIARALGVSVDEFLPQNNEEEEG